MFRLLKKLLGGGAATSVERQSGSDESSWVKWSSDNFPPTPPEGFVKLAGAASVLVAGTSFRLEDCGVVLSALKGRRIKPSDFVLERQKNRPEHPNAIGVVAKLGHRDVHIGYLPSDISDMIAHKFSSDLPLSIWLKEWGQKKSLDAVFFRVAVFAPNAKLRKSFELK